MTRSPFRALAKRWSLLPAVAALWILAPGVHAADWYDTDWDYRQKITISSSLADTTLSSFPYLVKITDSSNPLFDNAQSDGDDILFTGSDGTTKYDHEIEKYDDTGEQLFAWVRIPSLSSSANTEIYMYYGNSAVSTQENATAVWDADFVLVQHLEETSGTHYDSTATNNGSPNGSVTQTATGKIDGADQFDGSNDYINIADHSSLQVVEMTLEAWVYIPDSIPSGFHGILQHAYNTSDWYGLWNNGTDSTFHFRWSAGTVRKTDFVATIVEDTWYYVVGVLDVTADEAYTYLNGDLDRTIDQPDAPTAASGPTLIGAALSGPSEWFDGIIDEVRISKSARSQDWIEACFRNQSQTDTYQTVDGQEPDATSPADITDLAKGTVGGTSVELTWTASGDDGSIGTATTYDIRYRTDAAITSGNWGTATQVTSEPSPSVAGTSESFTVTGLSTGTTYYFAIKTADEVPNWSGLSNSPSATTSSDGTAPAAITDLATSGTPTWFTIGLTWTAPGDDGGTGTATSYDIRYSTSTITEGNWAGATQATGEPTPQVAGSSEVFTVTGLSPNTQYYFAVKASDEVFNTSSLSNITNNTTASSGGSTAEFHPSGAATGDEMDRYEGGTAATALDTNDGDTSYGKAKNDANKEGRLELDDSTQSGTIVSVQIKAYVRDNDDRSDDQMRLGLTTHSTEYWGSIIDNVDASHTLYSGTSYTTNPNTGSAWSWTEIDDLVALVDNYNGSASYYVTELYAEVIYEVGDSTAPAAVSDLATGTVTSSSIALSWTTPGDDGSSGTASVYDMRYSTSTITDGNWSAATEVTGEPSPSVAGSSESFTVTGLDPETTYYFAIKTRDEVPNISSLSNVPGATTIESIPPADVSDLATGTVTGDSVQLTWTAPGDDGSSGTATTYDIRYSTSAITAGNWAAATQATGEPSPSVAGTSESFTVEGLVSGTTYYFAIKTADEAPNWSGVSNSPSGATPADTAPPADITDLATGTVEDSSVELTWTAPGDDGATGTATTYDVRYRTDAAITGGNWGTATQVTGEPSPSVASTSESFTVTGLAAGTTYYFAVKTADEVPNWSDVSNSPDTTTDSSDTTAPAGITDLAITGTPTQNWIELTWTAPGDDGNVGTATSYDIRYSTSAITDVNWGSATQVTGEPSPQVAGSTEYFSVTGLSRNTTYYFAIKTSDEVPSTSALSNVPSDTTASGGGGGDCSVDDTGTYIEAEDYSGTIVQGTATFVEETTASGYNGDGYLRTNGESFAEPPDEEGKQYALSFPVSGTYIVWMRGHAVDAYDNSLFIGLNGSWVGALRENSYNAWVWTSDLQTGSNQVSVPSSGSHTLNIWVREGNHKIDGLYITKGSETPTGGIPSGAKVIDPSTCGSDTTAPAAITDLAASADTSTSIDLTWTAPGDDGSSGTASVYDIRYSTSAITTGNWGSATQVTGEPTPSVAGSSESFAVTGLNQGTTYYFAIKTRDDVPNISGLSNVPSAATDSPPVGGYTADHVIPAAQINQSTDGQGTLTVNWKGRDDEADSVTLNTFEYSVDGGSTWNSPDDADLSAALSSDWDDNGGSGWTTATTFASASAHSFTLDTQHADLSGLDGIDQSDVRVRFRLNDGTVNSDAFVVSESVRVDNAAPTDTITSASYSPATDTLTITGTNFLTIAAADTDIETRVDWTRFVWDVNGDDATTTDITFVVGDVTSLTVTNDTTLTLVFTAAKALAIETTTGYGSAGGVDTLDVTAGFSKDDFDNAATTDGVSDAPLTIVAPQLTIVKSSSVISDPTNGGTNPLRIPGAVVEYSVIVTNNGNGSPDEDTVVITDPIDSGSLAFDVTTGVTFTDGATSSGLSLGTVAYSSTAAPGPYVYDHTPEPDGDGYDGDVTSVKIPTSGTLAHGGAPAPSFTLKLRVKVK